MPIIFRRMKLSKKICTRLIAMLKKTGNEDSHCYNYFYNEICAQLEWLA